MRVDPHVNDSPGDWAGEMGETAEELAVRIEYENGGAPAYPPLRASPNRCLAALQGKTTDSEDN